MATARTSAAERRRQILDAAVLRAGALDVFLAEQVARATVGARDPREPRGGRVRSQDVGGR